MVFKQAGQSKPQGIGSSQIRIQGSRWSSDRQINPSFKESGLLKPRFKDPNGLQTSRSIQASENRVFSNHDSKGLQTNESIQASGNRVFSNQDSRMQMVFKQAGQSKLQAIGSSQTKIQRVFKQASQSKLQGIRSSQAKIQGTKWSSNMQVNPSFKESGYLKPRFKVQMIFR